MLLSNAVPVKLTGEWDQRTAVRESGPAEDIIEKRIAASIRCRIAGRLTTKSQTQSRQKGKLFFFVSLWCVRVFVVL